MAGVVQEEQLPLQQQQEEDLRPVQRWYQFVALLGASIVLYFVAGRPSGEQVRADAGFALSGFLLWLLGATRLLPFAQVGVPPHRLFTAVLAAATAKLVLLLEKMKMKLIFFFARQQEPVA